MFGEAPAGSGGGAAGAGEIVTIGTGDALNDAEVAQTGELSGQGAGRAFGKQWQEVGAAKAGDVEARTLESGKQGLFNVAEKVQPFDGIALLSSRQRSLRSMTGGPLRAASVIRSRRQSCHPTGARRAANRF